jgi:hypothetical protein
MYCWCTILNSLRQIPAHSSTHKQTQRIVQYKMHAMVQLVTERIGTVTDSVRAQIVAQYVVEAHGSLKTYVEVLTVYTKVATYTLLLRTVSAIASDKRIRDCSRTPSSDNILGTVALINAPCDYRNCVRTHAKVLVANDLAVKVT